MKQIHWMICSILLFSTPAVGAAQFTDLLSVLNVDASLPAMVQSLENPDYDPVSDNRFILLDGTTASITIIDPETEYFEAIVEVATGQWTASEEIQLFRAYILLAGPDFSHLFTSGADEITVGSQLIGIVKPMGTIADPADGSEVLFFEAYYVRTMP